MRSTARFAALAAALLIPACGGGGGGGGGGGPVIQPDFSLENVNPTPAPMTSGPMVSPRDYLGNVLAVYFGHAT